MKVRTRGTARTYLRPALWTLHWAMLGCALAFTGWPAFILLESAQVQWDGERAFAPSLPRPPADAWQRSDPPARGSMLGRLEVPRLDLSLVILEGTDRRTLDRSIGHVEGTSLPGEAGNIGLAGHRDTHFRKLEGIRRGDKLVLHTRGREDNYRVEWVRLFRPTDLEVLDRSHGPAVTLVTCFPFTYVGPAPLRMIVRALPEEGEQPRIAQAEP